MTTREELIEVASGLHDETGCSCDPRYLMSCPSMANAVLQAGRVIRERHGATTPTTTRTGAPDGT